MLAVDLNGTTGKRRSRVIKVITIISNHLLVHETRSFSVPLQAQQLSSYKLMWWKRAEERAGRFFFFSFLTVGKKAVAIMGKVANQEYLITAVRTHTGLCRHLLCPRFLWRIRGLTHLFHCLRASASRSVWWGKNHKPNQGNRYERHKQLYQSPPLQLSAASLGYTQAERCRPFSRFLKGHENLLPIKLSTQSPSKTICVRNACIIHLSGDRAREGERASVSDGATSERVALGGQM